MRLIKRIASGLSAAVLVLSSASSIVTLGFVGVAHATANNCTWTGATNNNFNTAANWSNCNSAVPQTGDNLVFDMTTLDSNSGKITNDAWTLTNDISSLSVGTITFTGSSTNGWNYVIAGTNAITITGATGITDSSSGGNSIEVGLTLGGDTAMTASTDGLNLGDSSAHGNLTFAGHTLTVSSGELDVYDVLSGAGGLSSAATTNLFTDSSGFSGTVTATAGVLSAFSAQALGTGATTVSSGASLVLGAGSTGITYANALNLTGTGSTAVGATIKTTGTGAAHTNGVTVSGTVTLGSDATFTGDYDLNLSGTLSGGHTLSVAVGSEGDLITSSGTTSAPVTENTDSDNQPNQAVTVGRNVTETVDGQRGDTTVRNGGTLKGTGQVHSLAAESGATVAPGHSPGTLTVLSVLNLQSGSTLQEELKDASAGDFDQIVAGSASDPTDPQIILGDTTTASYPTLNVALYSGASIKSGDTFKIIDNQSNSQVHGQFNGLPEGATFTVGSGTMKISYAGGDGNDVVLTAMSNIGTPNTGFTTVAAHPLVILAASVIAAATIFGLAQRTKLAPARIKIKR